jgi:hypothetical protein
MAQYQPIVLKLTGGGPFYGATEESRAVVRARTSGRAMEVCRRETLHIIERYLDGESSFAECISALDEALDAVFPAADKRRT